MFEKSVYPVAPARAAQVITTDLVGRLGLVYADGGAGARRPMPRPFVGGAVSGLHSVPRVGDWVLVHHEIHHMPNSVTCTTVQPTALGTLGPGETTILHADGRVACYLKNDGTTVVLRTPAGAQIHVDAAANIRLETPGRIDLEPAEGAYVNKQPILTYRPTP